MKFVERRWGIEPGSAVSREVTIRPRWLDENVVLFWLFEFKIDNRTRPQTSKKSEGHLEGREGRRRRLAGRKTDRESLKEQPGRPEGLEGRRGHFKPVFLVF